MISHMITEGFDHLPEWAPASLGEGTWRSLMILAVMSLLMALEAGVARSERRPRDYRQSYLTNFGALFVNDALMSMLSVGSLWLVASHYAGWGLLSTLEDAGLKAVLSFVLLDLTLYLWHRASHRLEWLWRFHKVHHSDIVMNVSTAFRLHFMEVLLTAFVKAAFIVVVGVDAAWVMANEALITLCVLFHHARIRVPGERWLGRVAIMPYLHRTHHSAVRAEHDSNYGAVFTFWDRLFGTLSEAEPAVIGLHNVPGQNLLDLLRFGFSPNMAAMPVGGPGARDELPAWGAGMRTRGASFALASHSLSPERLRQMIAEAAYYRAEKRGFVPGDELRDWIEAERECLGLGQRHPST